MARRRRPLRVLVAEDSRSARAWLVGLLEADGMTVIPAADGLEAVQVAARAAPDVAVVDLQLPGLDGIEVIARVMAASPCPIVVFSGQLGTSRMDYTFEALRAGALDVVAKPTTADPAARAEAGRGLIRTLRLMAQVVVVTRRAGRRPAPVPALRLPSAGPNLTECTLLGIGASTGGPPIVRTLLEGIRPPCRVPILVTQHIGAGFDLGYARWLGETGHPVDIPSGPTTLCPGRVYLAPAEASLVMTAPARVALDPLAPNHPGGILPSADRMFESMARHCGLGAAGILLTGMGRDGARGLKALRAAGGAPFAQDEASCVVFGMPRAAREAGAVDTLHSPRQLAALLSEAFSAL